MKMNEGYIEKLARARKKVKNIKNFYEHLKVYVIINLILMFLGYKSMDYLGVENSQDQGFIDWYTWNIIGTPILWGIGLLIHGLYVFRFQSRSVKVAKPKFLKEWEQQQIDKYIKEEESENLYN